MEGRWSRSTRALRPVQKLETVEEEIAAPVSSPPLAFKCLKANLDDNDDDDDDVETENRSMPLLRDENKRKRAPRGVWRKSLKQKLVVEGNSEMQLHVKPMALIEGEMLNSANDDDQGVLLYHSQTSKRTEAIEIVKESDSCEGLIHNQTGGLTVNTNDKSKTHQDSSVLLNSRQHDVTHVMSLHTTEKETLDCVTDYPLRSLEIVLPIKRVNSPIKISKSNFCGACGVSQTHRNKPEKKDGDNVPLSMSLDVRAEEHSYTTTADLSRSPDCCQLKTFLSDYCKLMKNPMDLGTIQQRLEKGEVYTRVDQAFADVALVWRNCHELNKGSIINHHFLQCVESNFSKLCVAAGLPYHSPDTGDQLPGAAKPKIQEAKKPEVKQIEPKRSSRIKKTKIIHYNPRSSQKAKIKRSAPVEQVMAESKAREQTLSAEAVDKPKQHHIVKSAVDVLGLADDQKPETSQAHCRRDDLAEMANINNKHDKIQLSKGVLFQRKKAGMSGGKRLPNYCCHGKDCNSPHDKTPVKPIGTLHHRQGCLCVVCVGFRRKVAKWKKGCRGGDLNQNESISKKVKKDETNGVAFPWNIDTQEESPCVDDHIRDPCCAHPSSDNSGYFAASYQLPPCRLSPIVLEIGRVLFDEGPGSLTIGRHSMGYKTVPVGRFGLLQAISAAGSQALYNQAQF
ncbi:unnamed protein product [Sphagnum troendelagicum]|uniref:Bromo domain-containing protein n=1 Tax=Sphagnum troendelagicum TaxID=128251 RepID=A0ABP0THY6_9BRYO